MCEVHGYGVFYNPMLVIISSSRRGVVARLSLNIVLRIKTVPGGVKLEHVQRHPYCKGGAGSEPTPNPKPQARRCNGLTPAPVGDIASGSPTFNVWFHGLFADHTWGAMHVGLTHTHITPTEVRSHGSSAPPMPNFDISASRSLPNHHLELQPTFMFYVQERDATPVVGLLFPPWSHGSSAPPMPNFDISASRSLPNHHLELQPTFMFYVQEIIVEITDPPTAEDGAMRAYSPLTSLTPLTALGGGRFTMGTGLAPPFPSTLSSFWYRIPGFPLPVDHGQPWHELNDSVSYAQVAESKKNTRDRREWLPPRNKRDDKSEVILIKPIRDNDNRSNDELKLCMKKELEANRSKFKTESVRQMRRKGLIVEVEINKDVDLFKRSTLEKSKLRAGGPNLNPTTIIHVEIVFIGKYSESGMFFNSNIFYSRGTELEDGNLCYLLEAPTGSEKTMLFTSNLMRAVKPETRVFLLQPTVATVGNNYVVSQKHEDSTDLVGYGNKKLTILSYGAALKRIQQIENRADYVLLDEIHCRSDPTVIAGNLQFTKKRAPYKCIHLTATVLTTNRAQRLADGLDISGTWFEIKENIRIEPATTGETTNGDWFVIPPGVTGVKTCGPDRQYLAIHWGTTFNLQEMASECWCFCTDVVGQAVTVPGCRVVIDFLEELKPNTVLIGGEAGLLYRHTLEGRRIGLATSKQRKGRTGRTNIDWYVTPRGFNPIVDYPIDMRTVAMAMLQLEAERRLTRQAILEHHDTALVKTMSELRWIFARVLSLSRLVEESIK
ncbi:hypothetical protein WN48_10893 [Eufriesea mexicana]|uniref:Helicase ATP-binding domain-containing protein n=1 Tax=Eufriesea mexicana TaxID=516756 RepID=A0A310S8Q0_9HYME|nr:hypothetical protein WN48_10893 [Eufriesea mexicana]